MSKRSKRLLWFFGGFALLLAALFGVAHLYLNSEGVQKKILAEVNRQLRCDVTLDRMKVRLLRGVDFMGIRVASDQVRPRDFMKADRLRVRYELYEAVVNQRLVIEEIKLSAPRILVDLAAPKPAISTIPPLPSPSPPSDETPSPPPTGGATTPRPSPASPSPHATEPGVRGWPEPPSVDLRKLIVEEGSLEFLLPDHGKVMLQDVTLKASASKDPVPTAEGGLTCPLIELPHDVKLEDAHVSFLWRKETISLQRIVAGLLGGSVQADFNASQKDNDMPFDLRASASRVELDELLHSLTPRTFNAFVGELRGRVEMQLHSEGTLAHPVASTGQGQVRVEGAHVLNLIGLRQLGSYLNRYEEFQDLPLQKCEADFVLESGKLIFPRVGIESADIRVRGDGSVRLTDQKDEFHLIMGLSEAIRAKLPPSTLEDSVATSDGWGVEIPLKGSLDQIVSQLKRRFQPIFSSAAGASVFDTIFEAFPKKKDEKKP